MEKEALVEAIKEYQKEEDKFIRHLKTFEETLGSYVSEKEKVQVVVASKIELIKKGMKHFADMSKEIEALLGRRGDF